MNGDSPVSAKAGISGRVAGAFVQSKLTPIAIIASVLLGLFAVWMLPREEEPQIKVPIVDVFVGMPGAEPVEVDDGLTLIVTARGIVGAPRIAAVVHPGTIRCKGQVPEFREAQLVGQIDTIGRATELPDLPIRAAVRQGIGDDAAIG